ncbi:MAG: efflux RND transporter permease subunit, partial [Bdellovibrio bacteriovorus]
MIAALIRWSLRDRLFVLAAALLLLGYGIHRTLQMPVDVFPDLTAPTVTVLAEAPGLAPTEMETLVTIPIESALNGSSGVRRVRSSTGIGSAILGEVMFIALRFEGLGDPDLMALKTAADWPLRRRLLAVSGVAQVVNSGGETRRYQVLVEPVKLADYRIGLNQVSAALAETNENTSAGFLVENDQEYLN